MSCPWSGVSGSFPSSLCSSQISFCFYREVFKAKHRQTGKKVALKKVLMENEKEGVSVGAWLGCVWEGLDWGVYR